MAIPVPALSSKVDPEVKRAIAAIITQFNSVLDGSTSVGRASVAGEATVISGSGGATGVIYPVGSLTAIPSFNTILLSWTDNQSRDFIAGYEVFRAGVDDLALAVRIGYTSSKGYIDTPPDTSTAVEYYYWVRPVTRLDAVGPFNALAGTMAATANDPAYALEILAGQITESELYADLNTRIDQIDTPTTGLIDSLAAEITARGDADTIIASQIDSLSVGAGEQFDTNVIWHFNTGVESWSGNGTPTAASGFIKQADDGSDPYLTSPTGINSDATTYPRVRLRYRKTGAPVWEGKIWWKMTVDSTWDSARSVTVTEPTYDADDIGEISTSMGWDGTIDQIRIDLISGQDASNYTEIDWAAIGRASPGASVASVTTEQTARVNADAALALDISNLTATVGINTADITTEQGVRADEDAALTLAISNLSSDVDDNTAAISSEQTTRANADSALTTRIDTLTSDVDDNTAAISDEAITRADKDTALASSVSSLQTTVGGHTASISTHQTSIAGVEAQYTVKLDNNGFMSGFGLASTWAGDTAYSEFYAMADRFAFINPAVSPKVITSITRSGTTATATCTAHGITSGTYRVIAGAAQGQYNGVKLCTSTGANTFTFQVSGSPTTPATVMEGLGSMNVSGSAASIPFIIDGGVVYMNVAMIKDATIGSAKIAGLAADKVTAGVFVSGISITDSLSALNTSTGALTVDNWLTVGTGGGIKCGKTAYGSGTGIYEDYNAGNPRWDVGNTTKYLRFDTTNGVQVGGDIIATGNLVANGVTVSDSDFGDLSINNTGTSTSPITDSLTVSVQVYDTTSPVIIMYGFSDSTYRHSGTSSAYFKLELKRNSSVLRTIWVGAIVENETVSLGSMSGSHKDTPGAAGSTTYSLVVTMYRNGGNSTIVASINNANLIAIHTKR
jgi:hypothetical protein